MTDRDPTQHVDTGATLASLTKTILEFRNARDWGQFHTPRNLATALSIEASELLETMLWATDEQVVERLTQSGFRTTVAMEVADVVIYALLLCEAVGIDPAAAIRDKLAENELKYPVELARGRADKYTDLR